MANGDPGSEAKLAWLSDPASYPDKPQSVEVRETHMSWVFLTDRHAYKLKKPVRFTFLDYSTLDARRLMCAREVELNRRLAPWVYLGVVALVQREDGTFALDAEGRSVDYMVKMHRLPAADLLDQAIADGTANADRWSDAAELVARFYADLPAIHEAPSSYAAELAADAEFNSDAVSWSLEPGSEGRVERLIQRLCAFVRSESALLEERSGRLVEGHGDLRPEHIYVGPPPAVIDCIEFNRDFRINDPVDELCFLAMECERLGASSVGDGFLDAYYEAVGDRPPEKLLAFYKARRALLRARLSLAHLEEPVSDPEKWHRRTLLYLSISEAYSRNFS